MPICCLREKTGLLNRLKLRAATNAWGIDVGRKSIKAVLLSFPAEATRPVMLDTALIPIGAGKVSTSATESVHAVRSIHSSIKRRSTTARFAWEFLRKKR